MDKPIYNHTYPHPCVFLGSLESEKISYDLYLTSNHSGDMILTRYGNKPFQFYGVKADEIKEGTDCDAVTAEAYQRAKKFKMDMKEQTSYPEHEKLKKVKEISQKLGELLDYGFRKQGLCLCEVGDDNEFCPTYKSVNEILSKFYDIDLVKIEEEKNHMWEQIRQSTSKQDSTQ